MSDIVKKNEMKEQRRAERREMFAKFYKEAPVGDKLAVNMSYIARTMRSQFEQKAGQKRILMMLAEQGTLTQRELTEQLGVRPGSASEILAKLENAGLITRTRNEADGRTIDVSLTEEGAALAAQSAEEHKMSNEDMFTCLTADEQETLLALLEKLHADWEVRFPGHHHGPHGHHGPCGCHGPHGDHGCHGHHGEFGRHGHHGHCGPHWDKPFCGCSKAE